MAVPWIKWVWGIRKTLDQLPLMLNAAEDVQTVMNISRSGAYQLMHREPDLTVWPNTLMRKLRTTGLQEDFGIRLIQSRTQQGKCIELKVMTDMSDGGGWENIGHIGQKTAGQTEKIPSEGRRTAAGSSRSWSVSSLTEEGTFVLSAEGPRRE